MQRLAILALPVLLVAAGCAHVRRDETPVPVAYPCAHRSGDGSCFTVARERFAVVLGAGVQQAATAVHVDATTLIRADLTRIDRALPGPSTTIFVSLKSQVIPQTGTSGYTNPRTGQITIGLDPHARVPLHTQLTRWLGPTLSHEVDHSVRILAGGGINATLLSALVFEGLSDAFDHQMWPHTPNPWDHTITASEEQHLWRTALPILTRPDRLAYKQWMLGAGNIPHWAGFTIGYHIIEDYLHSHPGTTVADITTLSDGGIFGASGYIG